MNKSSTIFMQAYLKSKFPKICDAKFKEGILIYRAANKITDIK